MDCRYIYLKCNSDILNDVWANKMGTKCAKYVPLRDAACRLRLTASAEERKGRRVGVASKYVRARRRMRCIRKWLLSCVCCSCATDAVRRAAARPFVRDAQTGMRLPESGSRLRLEPLSGSRMALLASWTNSLAAGRRTASVSQLRQTHDSDLLLHAMHSPHMLTYTHWPKQACSLIAA